MLKGMKANFLLLTSCVPRKNFIISVQRMLETFLEDLTISPVPNKKKEGESIEGEGKAMQKASRTLAIVTGANRGLGFEMCKQLAIKGYDVILAARSEESGLAAQEILRSEGHSNVEFMQLDTQSPESM